MNEVLSDYVKKNYAEGKGDLATVFVQAFKQLTEVNGSYAFIVPPSWLFLSNFEKLRKGIIDTQSIQSLLHLSRGVFGADFGAVASVIQNRQDKEAKGTYFRLVERTFQEFEQSHLRMLFEQTLANHDFKYRFKDYTKEVTELPYSEDGNRIYYPNVSQKNFEKIPGSPIGYWVSPKIQEIFASNLALSAVASPCVGLQTADNARFLRLWFEVSQSRTGFGYENAASAARSQKKWFPCNKGGSFRRWYGNQEFLVNWENDGFEIKNFKDSKGKLLSRPQNTKFYFMDAISWSSVSSSLITSFRYFPKGFIFDHAACNIFTDNPIEFLAYLNTNIVREFTNVINPTLNMFNGAIGKLPFLNIKDTNNITNQNISISQQDWDAHETSWDFQRNELLTIDEATYADNIQYLHRPCRTRIRQPRLAHRTIQAEMGKALYAAPCQ